MQFQETALWVLVGFSIGQSWTVWLIKDSVATKHDVGELVALLKQAIRDLLAARRKR